MRRQKIVATEKLEFKRSLLFAGNIMILSWTAIASFAIWLTYAWATWIFFLLAIAIIFILLRRLGCGTCAYCTSCTAGFGRISGWFFGDHKVKDTRNKTALAFVIVIYVLLGVIPISLLASSIVKEFDLLRTIVIACLLVFFIYSIVTWRKKKPN